MVLPEQLLKGSLSEQSSRLTQLGLTHAGYTGQFFASVKQRTLERRERKKRKLGKKHNTHAYDTYIMHASVNLWLFDRICFERYSVDVF